MTAKHIGARLRKARLERGLAQRALGRKAGVSQPLIAHLEGGRRGFRSQVIVKIARALEVPPFRFFMTDAEWRRWGRKT